MTSIIFIVWSLAILLNLYCGALFMKLYNTGLTNEPGRINFGKLKRAYNSAKKEEDKKAIKYCKKIYSTFLLLFYLGIISAAIEFIHAASISDRK